KGKLETRISKLEERVRSVTREAPSSPLDVLPPAKRGMYGQMIELIYECSTNRVAAKSLVDRILETIALSDDAHSAPSSSITKKRENKKRAATKRRRQASGRHARR